MPSEERRSNRREIREFILAQLGENLNGLTQGVLLERFTLWYFSFLNNWFDATRDSEFIEELVALGRGDRTMLCDSAGELVHRLTASGWLLWARAVQEEEALRRKQEMLRCKHCRSLMTDYSVRRCRGTSGGCCEVTCRHCGQWNEVSYDDGMYLRVVRLIVRANYILAHK